MIVHLHHFSSARPALGLRHAVRVALLSSALGVAALPCLAQAAETGAASLSHSYNIPGGTLSDVLNRFAREAGITLSMTPAQLQGRQSAGLKGEYSTDQALGQLLNGSGLEALSQDGSRYVLRALPETGAMALPTTDIKGFALGNALGSMEGYNATHSQIATKTSTALLETSQSVSVVTREQMDDQGSQTVSQTMRYTPGVLTNPYGATHRYDYVAMRGFNDGSVDNIYLDGLKSMGDSGTYSTMQVDPYFLERVDILKGPSSVLYGRSSPGGLVALTSKKPLFEPYHQIQATVGTQGQRGMGFDFSGPVDDDKRIAYRLTGLADRSDTQFDHNKEKRYALAPTLSIDFTDDTSLTLQAYLQHDPDGGYHSGMPADGALHQRNGQRISENFFEGEPGIDRYERDQQSFGYQFEHRFNDVFTARQNFRYLDSKVKLDQVYGYGWTTPTSNELNRYYTGGDEKLHAFIVDNMLQAEFLTGATKHTVLMGADYQRRKTVVDWTSGSVAPINAFDPVYGNSAITYYDPLSYLRRLEQTGVYLQDLIEMDQWRFSLGLRQDWVETSDENRLAEASRPVGTEINDKRTKLTGRAGALYLFDNGLAPYISYSESFNPNSYADSAGNPLAPTDGTQWELGLKYQPPGTDDLYTASLFRIDQENLATKLPQENFYRAVGAVRSQGLELEAHTQLNDNLKLLGSYTFTDIEYSKSMISTLSTATDIIENKGNSPTQAPRHMASLWADYKFDSGSLDGLRLGGGVRYVGYSWADAENTMKVPSYTLFDASIGYDLGKVGLKGVDVRLNANNLTNESYIASCASLSFCYMGEERNVAATVSYQF
ncbi:Ferrichrome-iron receptor [Pseudomonas chlororaphis subsp. aureofaciens]|uniref:Metal-pseudopaline receptor CntO n=1 Tax=Pseudomonas chlororaphis subsp. aureofaciens TaxID=587851 RepID=A0AAD1E497_9PSED|nr:TonB-dependent siderophore receptor [Pseudomonas chlororaphis]AZE20584.1 Ferrichrome-iron receptor [Pseudomonas chlororaphis subsp. aureofaciens]AZE26945.1 Ferrichrome-iron receptor [Pseudomonas chlororaphis subsp. aureofaciens]AZE33193.1 Ferrichrome-iron receptor [Pseudomonas chlororaphis subsp. aureofaciens]AZE39500.1 Ferrichrome-iron receptor [Pseudomonas chlororaphis subsp. aureofaciens]QHC86877.1 TonB-dependent siderophore receptor [Pseudomonas chlororaphis]